MLIIKQVTLASLLDVISHLNEHIITSFQDIYPQLKTERIDAVEDIQTSYWANYGGGQEVG